MLILGLFLSSVQAFAQSVGKEPVAIIELGAAAARNIKNGVSSYGLNIAAEVTPIERWLEIEVGVTPLLASSSTEWDTDLLFKKPWTVLNRAEFMVGAGPEWIHTSQDNNRATNSVGGEGVLDLMFWPHKNHKYGWYIEPGYDYNFGGGHEQSVGISGGLIIAIP